MRTTIQTDESKYRAELHFYKNGWTISYFDNKTEMLYWIKAMRDKYGNTTMQNIKEY